MESHRLLRARRKPYSQKADVFSYAIILWELLTGKEPSISTLAGMQIAYQVAEDGLRPQIPSICPEGYRQLVESCWAADPDARYLRLPGGPSKMRAIQDACDPLCVQSKMRAIQCRLRKRHLARPPILRMPALTILHPQATLH
mmetsp:Transcript_18165/g.68866  ORF Transcript_18165/g.68866 Transcript_18165/m.68866 type:complete len:143 (-) Transcript_18165:1083-1511(-)